MLAGCELSDCDASYPLVALLAALAALLWVWLGTALLFEAS
jgi:hypothetical protein